MFDASPSQDKPAAALERFDSAQLGRILLYTAIVTFCLAALASIGVILFGEFGGTEGRILLSSFSIAAYSLAGLIATARFERNPRLLAPLGLGSAGLGLVLTLLLIWTDADSDFFLRLTLSVMVLAIAFAHANLLLPDPARVDPAAALLAGTLVVSAILTAMIVLPILFDGNPEGGFYWKVVAVLAVLLVLGTLIVPVVRKISDGGVPSVAASPIPATPVGFSADPDVLEVRYRGRAFQVDVEPVAGDRAGFTVRFWAASVTDPEQIILGFEGQAPSNRHTALGLGVEEIARAVDDGRL